MPVPASINDLSTTPNSNSPAGSESPATLDDYQRTHASFIAQLRDGKQAADATLSGLASVTTAANTLIYATGVNTFATTGLSVFARTILDDPDSASARATLGANNAANLTSGTLSNDRLNSVGPTSPTLVNSFTNSANTRYIQSGKTVTVIIDVGRATVPDAGTTIFTLPAGLRPSNYIEPMYGFYTTASSFGTCFIHVSTAGSVMLHNATPVGAASLLVTAMFTFIAD